MQTIFAFGFQWRRVEVYSTKLEYAVGKPDSTVLSSGAAFNQRRIRSWDDRTASIVRFLGPDHQFGTVIVFLADVFEQFRAGGPLKGKPRCPQSRVGARVVDRYLVL